MSNIKSGQKVRRAWYLRLMEIAHNVGLLLPDIDGLLQLHLTLNDKHVNHTGVIDVLVPVKHLPHFVCSLASCDVQLKGSHCVWNLSVPGTIQFPNSALGFIQIPAENRFDNFSSTSGLPHA